MRRLRRERMRATAGSADSEKRRLSQRPVAAAQRHDEPLPPLRLPAAAPPILLAPQKYSCGRIIGGSFLRRLSEAASLVTCLRIIGGSFLRRLLR